MVLAAGLLVCATAARQPAPGVERVIVGGFGWAHGSMDATISRHHPAPVQRTVKIADKVYMPSVNLGTCCGSDPEVGLAPWLDAGGVGVDTAWSYGNQRTIAKIIALRGAAGRQKLFITSKIPGTGNNSTTALQSVRDDLNQLNMSRVDLVLLRHPAETPELSAELYRGLELALRYKLTRAIGVSNFNASQLAALINATHIRPAVNQCQMSLSSVDDATIAYCKAHNIIYESYDSLKGCPFDDEVAIAVANKHNVSVAQICIRWVLQKGAIVAVGTGDNASNVKAYSHLDLNVFNFSLTPEDMAALSSRSTTTTTSSTVNIADHRENEALGASCIGVGILVFIVVSLYRCGKSPVPSGYSRV